MARVSFHRGRLNKKTEQVYTKSGAFSFNIFGLIAVILVCACLFGVLRGSTERTFEGFLNMLANMPTVDIAWLMDGMNIVQMPDIPIIAELLGFFWSVCVFLVTIVGGMINALVFIFGFVGWLVV